MYGRMPYSCGKNGRGEIRVTTTEKTNSSSNKKIKILAGNHAAAYAYRHAKVEVVSAYPITPQSPVVEKISDRAAQGQREQLFGDGLCLGRGHGYPFQTMRPQ